MGRTVPGPEFQREAQPTRRPESGALAAGHTRHCATRECQSLERRGRPSETDTSHAVVSAPITATLQSVVMSNAVPGYSSQCDRGDLVIGAGIDAYTGYGQRGSFSSIESTLAAILELFPIFSRVRM